MKKHKTFIAIVVLLLVSLIMCFIMCFKLYWGFEKNTFHFNELPENQKNSLIESLTPILDGDFEVYELQVVKYKNDVTEFFLEIDCNSVKNQLNEIENENFALGKTGYYQHDNKTTLVIQYFSIEEIEKNTKYNHEIQELVVVLSDIFQSQLG